MCDHKFIRPVLESPVMLLGLDPLEENLERPGHRLLQAPTLGGGNEVPHGPTELPQGSPHGPSMIAVVEPCLLQVEAHAIRQPAGVEGGDQRKRADGDVRCL
jgi:hypothetical protein